MADLRLSIRRKSWLTFGFVALTSLLLFALANGANMRSDWSENQSSSLSPSTLSILNTLDEPIQIKAYFTAGLPQPYEQLKQFVEDTLVNYRDAGHGNIGFEMISPEGNSNVEASLKALQIPKVQVQVVEDDRAQVRQGYMAVVIEYLDKQAVIPVVQTDSGFEYLLTRKIKRLTGKGKQTIGLAIDFGAKGSESLQTLHQLLDDDYNLVDLNLATQAVPSAVNVLIVDGVDTQPSETFRYHVDQFRMSGGGVLVLTSNVKPDLAQGFVVLPVDAEANVWLLQDLGISVEPGLVMDKQASRITVNQQQAGFAYRSVVDYPFIPSVVDINQSHPASQGLENVSMPFSAPLLWAETNAHKQVLLHSSMWTSVQAGPPFDVDPLIDMQERFSGMQQSQQALMLAQDGRMVSSFSQAPNGVKGLKSIKSKASFLSEVENGRLIVSGSSALLDDEFISGDNTVLILNMLGWLGHDEALIVLRAKGVTQRPLDMLNKPARTFFKMVWIFALPSLVLMLAVWRWLAIRRRRA